MLTKPAPPIVSRLLLGACALVVLVAVGAYLRHAAAVLAFPYELTNGEGLVLRDAAQLRTGLPIYTDANQRPYMVSIYPPFFPVVAAAVVWATGPALVATRLVAIASTLLGSAAIVSIVRSETGARLPAVLSGAAFLSSVFVYQWSVFGRVDMLAIGLSLVSVALASGQPATRRLAGAALCCVAAVYTKQTALAAPLAIGLWLLVNNRRAGIAFLAAVLASGAGIFALLNGFSAGQFYLHTVVYNLLPYSLNTAASYGRALAVLHPVFVLGAITYGVWVVATRQRLPLPFFYAPLAGITALTVGRTGSSINHLIECVAALIALAGIGWGELVRRGPQWAQATAPLLLQIGWPMAVAHSSISRVYQPSPLFGYNPTAADQRDCHRLDDYVQATAGPVLAEDVAVVVAHQREAISNSWVLNVLGQRPALKAGYDQLRAEIAERRFPLVLLHWQTYPPEILATVAAHYHKRAEVDCMYHWTGVYTIAYGW